MKARGNGISMVMRARRLAVIAGAIFLLSAGATVQAGGNIIELEEAEVFIEWNSTDTDFGIQFFWDSSGFTSMQVKNASGLPVLDIKTSKNVRKQGLTEGFFESVEPPSSVLSMEQFLERFPEGEYTFKGKHIDGGWLVGEAEFTHTLPAPPENLSPQEGDVVSHLGFTASFDPVTEDTDGNPLTPKLYVVVIEKEDDDPILQTFTVILPPTQTSVDVPAQFLEPDTEYKLEVIVQEESGNRTIAEEGSFVTDSAP